MHSIVLCRGCSTTYTTYPEHLPSFSQGLEKICISFMDAWKRKNSNSLLPGLTEKHPPLNHTQITPNKPSSSVEWEGDILNSCFSEWSKYFSWNTSSAPKGLLFIKYCAQVTRGLLLQSCIPQGNAAVIPVQKVISLRHCVCLYLSFPFTFSTISA